MGERLQLYCVAAKHLLNGATEEKNLRMLYNEQSRDHRIKCMLATGIPKLVDILKQLS